jgi:hypothetical protein
MKFEILGKSDRPCIICGKPNTRQVNAKSDGFSGPLCLDHIAQKTDVPMSQKTGKGKNDAKSTSP